MHGGSRVVRCGCTVDQLLVSFDANSATESQVSIVRDNCGQKIVIEQNLHGTRADWSHLAQDQILRNSTTIIQFTECGSFQKNLHRLLKGATHEGSSVRAIDTVASNGHDVSPGCHHIAQNAQVTGVDIRSIKRQDLSQFAQNRSSSGFNAQNFENLGESVAVGSRCIDAFNRKYFGKSATASLEDIFVAPRIALGHVHRVVIRDDRASLLVNERT